MRTLFITENSLKIVFSHAQSDFATEKFTSYWRKTSCQKSTIMLSVMNKLTTHNFLVYLMLRRSLQVASSVVALDLKVFPSGDVYFDLFGETLRLQHS